MIYLSQVIIYSQLNWAVKNRQMNYYLYKIPKFFSYLIKSAFHFKKVYSRSYVSFSFVANYHYHQQQ